MAAFQCNTLQDIFWRSPTGSARISVALGSFIWGVMLLYPGETFSRHVVYHIMSEMAQEWVWGAAFMLHSVMLFVNGVRNTTQFCRLITNTLGAVLWVGVTMSIFVNPIPLPAIFAGHLALTVESLWILLRTPLGRE